MFLHNKPDVGTSLPPEIQPGLLRLEYSRETIVQYESDNV